MSYANYNNMTEHENNSNTSVDSKVSYGKNVKNDSYLYRPNNYNSDKEERKKKKKTGNDKGSIRESARSVGPLDKYQVEMRIDEEASFYSFQKEVQHDISRSYVGDSFPTSRQAKARRDSNEWRESGIGINIPDYPVKKSVSENDKYRLEKNSRTGKYEKSGKRGQRTYENTFEMSRPSSGKGRAVGKGSMSAPGESYEMKVKQKTLPTPYYSDDSHQPSSSDGKKLSVISVSSFHKDETLYDVVYDYTPNEYDELELKVGDRLRIIKVFSDGWALVKHHAQKNIGIVPMVCIDYKK
ncbi:hypothetical protein AX774_g1411 [Zancudomyces culisetae]|nr:hypothetical protein AX774_g1411 [Zancudomyces culisetae]|eukprot:OMH85051.1 hypothetical protein AX774_g1411 [Zancudomyces culisetae]